MGSVGEYGLIKDAETFLTENIASSAADGVKWFSAGDAGDTMFAISGSAALGIHAAGALAATANNLLEFNSALTYLYAQTGHIAIETQFRMDAATYVAINFGLNDDCLETSNTLPVELSTATWTANAGTYVGLALDTDATYDDFHCYWVNGTVGCATLSSTIIQGKSQRLSGMSLAADRWYSLRVELQDRGSGYGARANFTVSDGTGKSASRTFDTTIARDTALCYYLGIEQRTTCGAKNVYVRIPTIEFGTP